MQVIFDSLIPVFAIVLIGYLSGLSKLLSQYSGKVINEFVFYIALPVLFFRAIASSPLEELLNWQFIGANLCGFLASFLLAVIIGKFLFKSELSTLAFQGLTASFSNAGYMGIPLTIAAFGNIASLPAALATLILNLIPLTITVLFFEASRGKGKNLLQLAIQTSRTVLANPLVLAVVVGLMFGLSNVDLPRPIEVSTKLLADTAGPCALFALGFGLVNRSNIKPTQAIHHQQINILVILKLIFQPVVTLFLVHYVFELEPLWANVAILFAALPTGVATYVLAQKYETYAENVARAILISTVISVASLMAFLTTLAPSV
jgi:malonate transporter and related proteins